MGKIKVLTGNYTATEAAALCRPDLVAAYPITPQSSVVEGLAEKVHSWMQIWSKWNLNILQ